MLRLLINYSIILQLLISFLLEVDGMIRILLSTLFRSEERNQALRLCGWPHDQEASTLEPILDKLQIESQVSRAAALAVFHLKIRKAINILTRSGQQKNDVSYQLVALALAG